MAGKKKQPPPRDPYPMSSPQAAQLEASVDDQNAPSSAAAMAWTHMPSTTNTVTDHHSHHDHHHHHAGGDGHATRMEAATSLTGKRNPKKNDKGNDFYADGDADMDIELLDDEDNNRNRDDEFLDRPLWESRAGARWKARAVRWGEAIYHRLYGDDLPVSEMLRTLTLASTLFFMIGGYWTLRSLKDPVLTALCGVAVIPKAKMLSVVVVLAVVSIYNAFLDSEIPRHKLFYLFGTFYLGLFTLISFLLMHPTIGLANQQQSPTRILGWISYCSIESFGSVMVSLFWSFANSNFSLKEAKASYGVMVATAQVGSILGPTLVNWFAEAYGPAQMYLLGASCMLWLQLTMYAYVTFYGTTERNATTTTTTTSQQQQQKQEQQDCGSKKTEAPKKAKPGILEGLQLFVKYNYVKGIFAISCLFMVEVTIVDFTMKVLARDYFVGEHPCTRGDSCWDYTAAANHGMSLDATAAFTKFMGFFGQATNTLSLIMSLFGTSAVIRYLGLRLTLLLFPTLCLAVICAVRLHPTLYVVFGAMIALKAASYSLNNPTKEMLYQPTSSAVRYKAKSWIDIFGARGSKALGSVVTNAFSDNTVALVSNGSLVGMAVASFLIWNARFMGKLFDEYTTSGYIVGDNDDLDPANLEAKNVNQASQQNESEDTSCAIPQDDNDEEEEEEEEADSPKKPEVTMV
uniref:ADP,ATP carrier protein n=1 Tax=Amphora coffeiformis TaxID=265554 RepID=A0A7S3KZI7_9STRA